MGSYGSSKTDKTFTFVTPKCTFTTKKLLWEYKQKISFPIVLTAQPRIADNQRSSGRFPTMTRFLHYGCPISLLMDVSANPFF